jgi:glucose-1-phosphate adenylyltransferase
VLFPGVHIGEGASVKDSVIMPYVHIAAGAQIERAIIGRRTVIEEDATVGCAGEIDCLSEVTVISENSIIVSKQKQVI